MQSVHLLQSLVKQKQRGKHPAACSMLSSIAHTEPLPLVPPTTMIGKSGWRFSRCLTCATRSKPSAMVFGCRDSR